MMFMDETEETDFNANLFSAFEATIIAVYETGLLTPKILDAVAMVWRGYEIPFETGQLRASDGGTIDEICVGVLMGTTEDVWGDFLRIRKERWGWR